MDKLIEILNEINDEVDYTTEKELITGGILTSLDLLAIISAIEDEYKVEISAMDIIPDNFESIEDIWKLILSKRG